MHKWCLLTEVQLLTVVRHRCAHTTWIIYAHTKHTKMFQTRCYHHQKNPLKMNKATLLKKILFAHNATFRTEPERARFYAVETNTSNWFFHCMEIRKISFNLHKCRAPRSSTNQKSERSNFQVNQSFIEFGMNSYTHTPFEKQNERKKRKQFARRTSFRRNLIGFALVIVRRKKTEKKQTHQRIIFAFHWNHDDDDNVTTCHCINGESLWVP